MGGPLAGLRVVELQARGPGPFGVMILADLGAEVTRIVRPGEAEATQAGGQTATERMIHGHRRIDLVSRGRRLVEADLKDAVGRERVLALIDQADVLVEGFRPGVAERLGVGPDACRGRNPRLVYARITGWGQSGPYAQVPGHDINYVALSSVLDALRAEGLWNEKPGQNVLDLGAPFYNVYGTADGRYLTIGCGEPRFYAALLDAIGLSEQREELLRGQADPSTWPAGKARLAAVFRRGTLAQWCDLLEGTDTCFAPVLTMAEAPHHPHNRARGTFVEADGVTRPAPAPRFSRTPLSRSPDAGVARD